MEINELECCAVQEIDGIKGLIPYAILGQIGNDRYENDNKRPFYIFTESRDMKEGANLATYIKKHHLGNILITEKKINPNTTNFVKVYLWTIHKKNFREWYLKNIAEDLQEEDDDN